MFIRRLAQGVISVVSMAGRGRRLDGRRDTGGPIRVIASAAPPCLARSDDFACHLLELCVLELCVNVRRGHAPILPIAEVV